jgi:Protein of unknown function (DUF3176)
MAEEKHLRDGEESSEAEDEPMPPNWKPGYFRRFPILGALCLLSVVLCACGSVGVLVGSNHKSSTKWTPWLAPNVCIQGLNAISNILLAVAITEGIAISWWRKAMRGASVAELHRSWE